METSDASLAILKSESWKMFNDISPRYDLLNHLLSFGLDIAWRKRLAQLLPAGTNLRILDLATGTADVLLSIFKNSKKIKAGYGIDLADKMLAIGREKIAHKNLGDVIKLQTADANQIPFANNDMDCITMAFGIRNVQEPKKVLKEMHRVLNPTGRALILEFSLPPNKLLRGLHLFYLRQIVPAIGAIFSGHYQAYKYLNQTIETFPYGEDFCRLMKEAGFINTKANPLLWGVATIYQGDKENS